ATRRRARSPGDAAERGRAAGTPPVLRTMQGCPPRRRSVAGPTAAARVPTTGPEGCASPFVDLIEHTFLCQPVALPPHWCEDEVWLKQTSPAGLGWFVHAALQSRGAPHQHD